VLADTVEQVAQGGVQGVQRPAEVLWKVPEGHAPAA